MYVQLGAVLGFAPVRRRNFSHHPRPVFGLSSKLIKLVQVGFNRLQSRSLF